MAGPRPRVAIIVQARMGSTRLPGKVLKTVLGKPLLEYQLERLARVADCQSLAVATSTLPGDDPIELLAARRKLPCFRGSEQDVLSRYYHCARKVSAQAIVRSTADCPLIDPGLVSQLVGEFLKRPGCAYGSNATIDRTYPRGLDAEIFTFKAIEESFHEATDPYDREHVTQFITDRPRRYPSFSLKHSEDLSAHRWTVDTPEDFELVRRIIEALYPKKPAFSWLDVLALMNRHPDWAQINAHIEQKPGKPG